MLNDKISDGQRQDGPSEELKRGAQYSKAHPHDLDVAGAVEGVVEAPLGHADQDGPDQPHSEVIRAIILE